jgi:hypothetical protein
MWGDSPFRGTFVTGPRQLKINPVPPPSSRDPLPQILIYDLVFIGGSKVPVFM